jgi:HEAT repeat protein
VKSVKNVFFIVCFVFATVLLYSQDVEASPAEAAAGPAASPPAQSLEEQRLDVIRYGTETELAALIKNLRSELLNSSMPAGEENGSPEQDSSGETPLDRALKEVAETTKNRSILSGIFSFFADRKRDGLEERAIRALEERDDEAVETVLAAIDYLGKLEVPSASAPLTEILNGEESRFLNAAIRALGRSAKKGDPEKTALYLVEYYENRNPGDENRREIITALGETASTKAVPFLSEIVENNDERVPLRMAALGSLAKIGGEDGLPAILNAAASTDPNVRSSAIGALGPFDGEKVDSAIIEAFRDSYYRTRLAAAQAARERKLAGAVPFLRYRSEHDEIPAVRDESIKALAAIGTGETEEVLGTLFEDRKNSDRVRILAGEMLLAGDSAEYVERVIAELEEAKTKNQTALYNGFLRILGQAKTARLEGLAKRFFDSGGVVEKSYAIDICSNNGFRSLEEEIRKLLDSKIPSLSRKSKTLLEKWGLE